MTARAVVILENGENVNINIFEQFLWKMSEYFGAQSKQKCARAQNFFAIACAVSFR